MRSLVYPCLVVAMFVLLPRVAMGDSQVDDARREALDAARQAIAAGHGEQAAAALETAYRNGARNATVCLALARLADQRHDAGHTVLWLLRGQRWAPGDPTMTKALEAAGVVLPGPRWARSAWLAPRTLIFLTLGANTVFWLILGWRRRRKRTLMHPAILAAGLVLTWLWLETGLSLARPALWPVDVVRTKTMARCAPDAEAETLFVLSPGQVVRREKQRNGFARVCTDTGRLGWIATKDILDPYASHAIH